MKTFVIDNSVVMAWYFEDEASDYTVAVLESLNKFDCIVPSIWPLEVAKEEGGPQRRKQQGLSRFLMPCLST